MIPARLLLRALTVLTLTRGGSGPFPTMAGAAVFDTRIDPIVEVAEENQHLPLAIVYTDNDQRKNLNTNTSGGPWSRSIDLVIEIALGSIRKGSATEEKAKFEFAETDAEMEALLDFFEAEVELALADPVNPYAVQWRLLVKKWIFVESVPHRSSSGAQRLAVRQLRFEVEIAADCRPKPTLTAPTPPVITDPETGEFIPGSLMPIPYLVDLERSIATSVDNPIFENTRAMLLGASLNPVLPALQRIAIMGDFIDPADPNRLQPGQTHGPDGRIEVAANLGDLDQ